ncbi:MAG: M48 family metalloprotease [Steroidobacteraceae bacterium]|nr:M48 family metalloprotease [Steroidobacteraceae bacterium]
MDSNRRLLLTRGLCGCALCLVGSHVLGRVLPSSMVPLVEAGYEPVETDERGLWQECDRLEDAISHSNLLIKDAGVNAYVRGVIERLFGANAGDVRTYLVRDPDFNASMFPNGMMLVHTGLMARVRNEAQLAAVLGHEAGHYLRRHSLRQWRDMKAKTAVMSVLALAGAAATGATGNNWYDIANAINSTLLLSVFQFSREMESEADAYGLKLLFENGYTPDAAASVWAQLIEERKASAAARKKRYKDHAASAFSTHPPSEERMEDLAASSRELQGDDGTVSRDAGLERWRAAIAPLRAMLLDEQIKLNDSGASLYLLNSLAADGWDGTLKYYEGEAYRLRDEPGDSARASEAYAAAIQFPDAPAEAWRAHGYAQMKAGNMEEGRRALARYLELSPDAVDAAMVRFSLGR